MLAISSVAVCAQSAETFRQPYPLGNKLSPNPNFTGEVWLASLSEKKELNVPDEIFNVNGGAIALGHPIGCSGARVITTLLYALKNRNKDVGLGTLCLGGGNAVSMIIRRC